VFPADFVWGAAASAYQTEGAVHEDGRGESIWDRFCARPGAILTGESGAVACDSYHRWREDLDLVEGLGLDAYRFSIAWPRVVPAGRGRVNPAGLDYYDRVVDGLLAAGIRPFVTLYHWDLPQPLEDRGGWPERDTAHAFAEYVDVVAERLGDRVEDWITICEPRVVSWLGYGSGEFAPGRQSTGDALAAAHHVLLAHAFAAERLRARAGARVGICVDLPLYAPLTPAAADRVAARVKDGTHVRMFLDPLLRGVYPEDVLEAIAPLELPVRPGDLERIAGPLDFLGVNYYTRELVSALGAARPAAERTAMGWEVYPQGLCEVLCRLSRDYRVPPVFVTENGAAYDDVPGREDSERVRYLGRHLGALAEAMDAGVQVRGYFVWSLLDNFEWAFGYSRRFGLVYTDYETLERIPKASYAWYRDVVAASRPVSLR
jgi:beta-glucosidase